MGGNSGGPVVSVVQRLRRWMKAQCRRAARGNASTVAAEGKGRTTVPLHARDVLEKRGIAVAWVERVLAEPQRTEADTVDTELEHRLGRVEEFDNRVLRVIVDVERTPPNIVTAFFDRRRVLP